MLRSALPETNESGGLALSCEHVRLTYTQADGSLPPILDLPKLTILAGETWALIGPSGSGKTSLLHVLSGIEPVSHGRVMWGEHDISAMSASTRAQWRARHVGLVFQDFYLEAHLCALDNVLLPMSFRHWIIPGTIKRQAIDLLTSLGLSDPHLAVRHLSRGEKQRVAIARALLRKPSVLLADEPTASLDDVNAQAVIELLMASAKEYGATLLVATHDLSLVPLFSHHLSLRHTSALKAAS